MPTLDYQIDSYSSPQDEGYSPVSLLNKPLFAGYLLFNGILGDRRPASGNVLAHTKCCTPLRPSAPLLVYGEACRVGPARMAQAMHIPYDVRVR